MGGAILPREPPTALPTDPKDQHDMVRRFLLSCTAKDCSVMIALKPAAAETSSLKQPSTSSSSQNKLKNDFSSLPRRDQPPEITAGGERTIVHDVESNFL